MPGNEDKEAEPTHTGQVSVTHPTPVHEPWEGLKSVHLQDIHTLPGLTPLQSWISDKPSVSGARPPPTSPFPCSLLSFHGTTGPQLAAAAKEIPGKTSLPASSEIFFGCPDLPGLYEPFIPAANTVDVAD